MEKMSLKTFLNALERRLTGCSAEELRTILRAIAREMPPSERRVFLDQLEPAEGVAAAIQEDIQQDELLSEIDDFAEELRDEMERMNAGAERHGWSDYYHDEDSLGPYAEYVEPLTALFDRAAVAFKEGNRTLARAAYEKLFEVFDVEDDYGRGLRAKDLPNVNMDDVCARYLRAVYETELPERRPEALYEQMQKAQRWLERPRPMLESILRIVRKPLPDRDCFLSDWAAWLQKQKGRDADAWLREAVRLAQGTEGLAKLARAEGKQRPRAYLDWLTALEQEGRQPEALAAARQALETLPRKLPIRAAIADHLCRAAARRNDTPALLAGRWEAFAAQPVLSRLLDLWDTAPTEPAQTRWMQQAVRHLKEYFAHPPRREFRAGLVEGEADDVEDLPLVDQTVLAHAYLLANDLSQAHRLAARQKALGWSRRGNPQGLLVALFLIVLSGKAPEALPQNLRQLWQWGLESSLGFGFGGGPDAEEKKLLTRLERLYRQRLPHMSLSRRRQEAILAWCLSAAKQRASAVVSNQRRASYGNVAALIGACAEVLKLRGAGKKAEAWLEDVRNRFPRHRAFQDELNAAVREN